MSQSTAKLFKNGGSQAVRLPKECRFPDGVAEVSAHREGSRVILELVDQWPPGFFEALRGGEAITRPHQQPLTSWRNPLDPPARKRGRP